MTEPKLETKRITSRTETLHVLRVQGAPAAQKDWIGSRPIRFVPVELSILLVDGRVSVVTIHGPHLLADGSWGTTVRSLRFTPRKSGKLESIGGQDAPEWVVRAVRTLTDGDV